MYLRIKKASIKNSHFLYVEYEEVNDDGTINTVKKECQQIIHEDLKNLYKQLNKHLAMLTELLDSSVVNDLDTIEVSYDSLLSKMDTTGFTIGGTDDHEGVCIIGQRKLKGNKVLNLVSPFTKWNEEGEPYDFIENLQSIIDDLKYEVNEYLLGKCAPPRQMVLDFEESSNESFEN